jgi:hypothetical protein
MATSPTRRFTLKKSGEERRKRRSPASVSVLDCLWLVPGFLLEGSLVVGQKLLAVLA